MSVPSPPPVLAAGVDGCGVSGKQRPVFSAVPDWAADVRVGVVGWDGCEGVEGAGVGIISIKPPPRPVVLPNNTGIFLQWIG